MVARGFVLFRGDLSAIINERSQNVPRNFWGQSQELSHFLALRMAGIHYNNHE